MMIIRVVDFETTGTDPADGAQVCEVGIADYNVETTNIESRASWLCGVDAMPPDVRAVHHISLAECKGAPPFAANELHSLPPSTPAAFAAHNSAFETKFFDPLAPMICTYKAALRIWPDAPSHKNGVLFYWLEDQGLISPDHSLAQPSHRAGPNAYVTAWLLKALFAAGATGKDMVAWTKEPPLLAKCPIGKEWRGKPWSEVDAGFLGWMLRQTDMEEDLKWNARREIERRQNG